MRIMTLVVIGKGVRTVTATIWAHWFRYYVAYTDGAGNWLKTECFDTIDEAKADARHWGAFIITR